MPKVFVDVLGEGSSARYTAILKDEAGVLIPVANINTLTLTLFNLKDETIINSRNAQDVKNLNNVTIDSNGLLTWNIQALDTPIVDTTQAFETHRALFSMVWDSSTKQNRWTIDFTIRNLAKVS